PPADAHPGPRPATDVSDDSTAAPGEVATADTTADAMADTATDATAGATDARTEPVEDAPGLSHRERLLVALLGPRRLALGATAHDHLWGWLGVAVVAAVAAVLRLWDLGRPGTLVFDETYYVKQAWTLLRAGFEANWPEEPNPAFEAGDVDSFLPTADYVVHPPLGKWMIALGMRVLGGAENPWTWRLASALVGGLAVVLVARIARPRFASTGRGAVAGRARAGDGRAVVPSGAGRLGHRVMVGVLVAFGCLRPDPEQARRGLPGGCGAALGGGGRIGRYGPGLGWRWG